MHLYIYIHVYISLCVCTVVHLIRPVLMLSHSIMHTIVKIFEVLCTVYVATA